MTHGMQYASPTLATRFLNLFTPIVPYHNAKCQYLSENPTAHLTDNNTAQQTQQIPYCQSNARYQVIFLWSVTTLMVLAAGLFHNLFPIIQFAHLTDIRYHYPYFKESVNSIVCFGIAAGVPLGLLMLPYILGTNTPQTIQHKYNIKNDKTVLIPNHRTQQYIPVHALTTWCQGMFSSSVLGCFISLGLGTFLTTLFKTIVGRPRPNALALTQHIYTKYNTNQDKLAIINNVLNNPMRGFTNNLLSGTTSALTTTIPSTATADLPQNVQTFFTNTPHMLSNILANDALRSFPSGHSCFAFAGMIYLALILYTRYLKTVKFATTTQHTPAPLRIVITPRAILNVLLYPIDYDRIKALHCCYHPPSTIQTRVEADNVSSFNTRSGGNSTDDISNHSKMHTNNINDEQNDSTNLESEPILTHTSRFADRSYPTASSKMSPKYPQFEPYLPHHFLDTIEVPPLALAMICYIIIPIIIAGLIAISRIIDFWHHPDDVLAGSVLGTCCAFLTYRIINY